jgi:putative DNA primase/helicase
VQRKNLLAVTTKLPTRVMIATNELPNLRDASGAFTGRLLVLRLTNSFAGREDTGLSAKITPELPGILLWAVDGLRRLRQRGRFVQPASGRVALDQLSELSSPVQAFVEQRCQLDPEGQVIKSALYQAWHAWCDEGGYNAGDTGTFTRNLVAAYPQVRSNGRGSGVGRPRVYKGIGLKPDEDEGPTPLSRRPCGPSR